MIKTTVSLPSEIRDWAQMRSMNVSEFLCVALYRERLRVDGTPIPQSLPHEEIAERRRKIRALQAEIRSVGNGATA